MINPASNTPAQPPVLFEDRLGTRFEAVSPDGDPVEVLELTPQFANVPSFEFALRKRVNTLTTFTDPSFATVRGVRLGGGLAVVSDRIRGTRLSTILEAFERDLIPIEFNATICILRQLVPALAILHETMPDICHGAVAPERIVITPEGRVVIVEQALGAALEVLNYNDQQYWEELRIAIPKTAGRACFDQRSDVLQIGLVTLALIHGRSLNTEDYPVPTASLSERAWAATASGGLEPLPAALRSWMIRTLQLEPRQAFATAMAAWSDLKHALPQGNQTGELKSLRAALTRYGFECAPVLPARPGTPKPSGPVAHAPVPVPAPPVPTPIPAAPESEPIAQALTPAATPRAVAPTPVSAPTPARMPAPSATPVRTPTPAAFTPARAPMTPAPMTSAPMTPGRAPMTSASITPAPAATVPAKPHHVPTVAQAPAVESEPAARTIRANIRDTQIAQKKADPDSTTVRAPRDREDSDAVDVGHVAMSEAADLSSVEAFNTETDAPHRFAIREEQDDDMKHQTPWWRRRSVAAVLALVLLGGVGVAARSFFAPPPAAPVTGTLIVDTNPPGVPVILDGKRNGQTPITLQVSAGSHVLTLLTEGPPRTIPLTITAGATVSQFVDIPKPVAQTGRLEIRTQPSGARVVVDGAPRGTAPLTVEGLTPGSHTVEVSNGVGSVRQEISVTAGVTASLVVPMATTPSDAPISGWISVSAPADVQVYEEDRLLGSSRSDRLMVSVGRHELDIVNETLGYRTTRVVNVTPGQVAAIRLDWPNGSMALNAQPWAEVFVDGERVGETPIGNVPVPIGTHEVRFRHPELGEQVVRSTVTQGAPTRLSVDLRKR